MLKPFKFIVQAVLIEEEDGRIIGEQTSEPVVFYSPAALAEWMQDFESQVDEVNSNGAKLKAVAGD